MAKELGQGGIKFYETLTITLSKLYIHTDVEIETTAHFSSRGKIAINEGGIEETTMEVVDELGHRIDTWLGNGSGWVVVRVDEHVLSVVRYNPLAGGTYVVLPKELQNSQKGLINP